MTYNIRKYHLNFSTRMKANTLKYLVCQDLRFRLNLTESGWDCIIQYIYANQNVQRWFLYMDALNKI